MTIPAPLINRLVEGRVVLFLGAGALQGTSLPHEDKPVLGEGLRDLIADQFLDGDYKNESLAFVADLAVESDSLFALQDFIARQFENISPADFHFLITQFNWRAIFTTNYDRLVEKVYENSKEKFQIPRVILSNSDDLDETRRTNDIVPLVKLHGCITHKNDTNLPLILSTEQYLEYKKHRDRLFSYLYDLGHENTIVFVGHRLQDSNIREVIKQIGTQLQERPRYYIVRPGVKNMEVNYWSARRISVLDLTFEQFLKQLDENISSNDRKFSSVRPPSNHPVQGLFVTHEAPSRELVRFLTDDADYLYKEMAVDSSRPALFYSGSDLGWYPIAEGLNVHRNLGDKLRDIVQLTPEEDRAESSELIVLKGEAGSGKTIILRQAAWDAKDREHGAVLWINSLGEVDVEILREIYQKTRERILLFWDNAANNIRSISRISKSASRQNLPLTIITAERFSEWNNRCTDLEELVSEILEVRYLNEGEIEELINLLDKYKCLGPNLEKKGHNERVRELREVHGRQLLVALHEATMGKRFEDIIGDEYKSIEPEEAKLLYRTVCTLNRLRVPVRAGLLGRIYGISFTDFKKRLHKPLEKVVLWRDQSDIDAHYVARHPDIAEIVFDQAFRDSADRFNEYVRILDKINISYKSDRISFRGLVRARNLTEAFNDYEDIKSIYQYALKKTGREGYLLQQMANFERIRSNGSLDVAKELLEEARSKDPQDESIVHSLAVVWRDKASETEDASVRAKRRNEARSLLYGLRNHRGHTPYIDGTLVELAAEDLQDVLSDEESSDHVIDEAMRKAEAELSESKLRFPEEGHLHKLEAKLAETLRDSQRATNALERAFRKNDRDPLIAVRLASVYENSGNIEKALQVLGHALERRRTDRNLHFHYGELLRQKDDVKKSEISYHYRRAYTPGDKNYESKFWDARYAIESDDQVERNRALEIFRELKSSRVSHKARTKVRDLMGGWNDPIVKFGTVTRKMGQFGFVKIDGWGMSVYFSDKDMDQELWEMLEAGDRLKCYVAYTYKGARCYEVELV